MIVEVVQRWRDRRGVYRPARETIRTGLYEVAPIPTDREARAFVEAHHYLGTYPAARRRFGLYEGPFLVGVGVFSVPANDAALACLGCDPRDAVELGRLVLLDRAPANAESFFVGRCFELLRREGMAGVVSFSDPEPRTTTAGGAVFQGHIGTIYQATNGIYLGRSRPNWLRLLPDGTILSPRALAKIRKRDCGWRYAAAALERHGAAELTDRESAEAWLAKWLPRLTRQFRHGGNHKYAWGFARATRKAIPLGLPYPKFELACAPIMAAARRQ